MNNRLPKRRCKALMLLAFLVMGIAVVANERALRRLNMRIEASRELEPIFGTLFDYDDRWTRTRLFLHRVVGTKVIVGVRMKSATNLDLLRLLRGCRHLYYLEIVNVDSTDVDGMAVIAQVSGMREFRDLRVISFDNLAISDFSPLKSFQKLEGIDLSRVGKANWDSLAKFTNLKWINLRQISIMNTPGDNERISIRQEALKAHLPKCRIINSSGADFLSLRMYEHFQPSH